MTPTRPRGDSDRAWLEEIEARLEPIYRETRLAEWGELMGRPGADAGPWRARAQEVLASPGVRERARRSARRESDPARRHQFRLLDTLSTDARIEQNPAATALSERLDRRIVEFRPVWNGRRTGWARVQRRGRTDPDRGHRRSAWKAGHGLGFELEPGLRALALARNERAREFGFRTFYEWRATREGISLARLDELIDAVAPVVRAANRRRREAFEALSGDAEWLPWDTRYYEHLAVPVPNSSFPAGEMVESVRSGVAQWGFPRRSLSFRIDRHELPTGGIEIPVDPPGDVRVIVHPDAGWVRYMILFHEVGHAVQARSNAPHPPLLRWHEFVSGYPGMIEGVGTLFEEIPRTAPWLMTRSGIDRITAARFERVTALGQLAGLSWLLARIRLERELYRRPDSDLRAFLHRWERSLGDFDDFAPAPFAEIFFVRSPVYLQSYLFAQLFARHLLSFFAAELGPELWPNRRIGPWLVDHWFRESGEYEWVPRVRESTGRAFGPAAFLRWARAVLVAAGG